MSQLMSQFIAKHVSRTHSIILSGPPEIVFPLFSPAGEEQWVKGWHPRFLYPDSGETREGMIFTTGQGDEETLWSLVEFDATRYHARYVRVTPASRFGFVEVSCEVADDVRTRVRVTYTYTALTEAWNSYIDGFTDKMCLDMMESWQKEIESYLSKRPRKNE